MEARLRYSDRRHVEETGGLGELKYDAVPEGLRAALTSIYRNASKTAVVGKQFDSESCAACEQHLGRRFYAWTSAEANLPSYFNSSRSKLTDVLDVIEIIVEEAERTWVYTVRGEKVSHVADSEIQARLNTAFVRHRFGYRIESGQIVRVGSPALDEVVVGPALFAARLPGWEHVDRSFRSALAHRLAGSDEYGAAITDAHAALESALIAAGFKGNTLSALAKGLRNSGVVLPQLEGVPEAIDTLLKRSQAIRDPLSDSHGRESGALPATEEVVDLAIHLTGAFIVYLAASSSHET